MNDSTWTFGTGHLTVRYALRRELGHYDDDNEDEENDDDDLLWNRFLTMLSQEESSTSEVTGISFWVAWLDRPNDQVLERLFRDILPALTLGSLTTVTFLDSKILPVYIDMFLTSINTNYNNNNNHVNLRTLQFTGTKLHPSNVAAIARLLCPKNGIRQLLAEVYLQDCSIDSTGCELILKALDGNTSLRLLNLSRNEISEMSLEAAKAIGNCKTLSSLDLDENPLSEQSLVHLVEGLRTNQFLTKLRILDRMRAGQVAIDAFAELLTTFNYSLQKLSGLYEIRGRNELFCQNKRIKQIHDNLLVEGNNNNSSSNVTTVSTRSYHLQQLYLWPIVLECIANKPSLIYHFVRQGNLVSFADQVLLPAGSNSNKNVSKSKSKEAESDLDNNNPQNRSRAK